MDYPLDTSVFVGTSSGATSPSFLMTLWQRSAAGTSSSWGSLSSPPAAPVSISIPSGMSVSAVLNLTSRAAVPYTVAGSTLNTTVSDDPVEVLFVPHALASVNIAVSNTSVTVGATIPLSCAALTTGATKISCPSPVYTSSNPAIFALHGTSGVGVAVGTAMLTVSSGSLSSATLVTVTPLLPTLAFAPVSAQVAGGPAFQVSASSASTGSITYSVLSGPATIVGSTVTPNAPGTVVLRAVQSAAGNYAQASTQTSFTINAPATVVNLQLPAKVVSTQLALPNVSIQISRVGSTYPTGTVQILIDSKPVWSYTYTTANRGSLGGIAIPPLPVGQHTVTAFYAGDTNYPSGLSSAYTLTVVPNETSITVSCATLTLPAGVPLSCNIQVAEGSLPVQGSVTYTLTGMPARQLQLSASGSASITLPHPAPGSYKLGVSFPAQGAFPACPYVSNTSVVSK